MILDENALAKGKSHCDVHCVRVSPNHQLLAYTVDFSGNEVYELIVIDLRSGEQLPLPESVKEIYSYVLWGSDASLFYLTQDAQLRPVV